MVNNKENQIYLDNAATSGNKPDEVIKAIVDCLQHANANPGRSAHSLSIKAAEIIYNTREVIGELFNFPDTENIILTKNASEALNIAICGTLEAGDGAITTSMEHNSILRPLNHLKEKGLIDLKIIRGDKNGLISSGQIRAAITDKTKLIAVTAASNAFGVKQDISGICELAQTAGVKVLVDAAQGAGGIMIDLKKTPFDFFAITGHKHLFGPQGTGALIIKKTDETAPFMRGGTGSLSDQIIHPDFPPDKFEAGTLNTPGYAGLAAGVKFLLTKGIANIVNYEQQLTRYLIDKMLEIEEIEVYAPEIERVAIVSFNIRGKNPSDVSHYLDSEWGILCRPGLHCAPEAHKNLNTFPKGTVRFSLSCFNNEQEIETTITVLKTYIKMT
ncbi:MAG: aminotransferase class V-fold PLP-dependent enzyme [bacterium]